eukprot:scaffold578_cov243-Pinguiococcus_pyrenoidosus.AAC.18
MGRTLPAGEGLRCLQGSRALLVVLCISTITLEQEKDTRFQSSPVQSSPVQSNPIQSNPVQSNPVQLIRLGAIKHSTIS